MYNEKIIITNQNSVKNLNFAILFAILSYVAILFAILFAILSYFAILITILCDVAIPKYCNTIGTTPGHNSSS